MRESRAGGVGRVDVGRGHRVRVRKIVTLNFRRLSMREHNRDRLHRIEIVLMEKIRADERGVV